METRDIKSFNSNLRGTWVSNDPSIYSGSLVIDYDRITITGYNESQTPSPLEGGNDNNRPFKGFPKGIALKGYAEEGNIYIEDRGTLREGIPYTFQEDNSYPPRYKIISFNFGGREETLECK